MTTKPVPPDPTTDIGEEVARLRTRLREFVADVEHVEAQVEDGDPVAVELAGLVDSLEAEIGRLEGLAPSIGCTGMPLLPGLGLDD